VGSEILISFYPIPWVPRRVSWLACITQFEWNSHFCDAQVRGPFTVFQHRHGIEKEIRDGQEGTLVSDAVEFELPYGVLGRIAGAMVRSQLARSFAYRQKRLPEILAAAERQAARRGVGQGTGNREQGTVDRKGPRVKVCAIPPFRQDCKLQVLRLRCASLRMTERMGHGAFCVN
jgi:hypothetical protein